MALAIVEKHNTPLTECVLYLASLAASRPWQDGGEWLLNCEEWTFNPLTPFDYFQNPAVTKLGLLIHQQVHGAQLATYQMHTEYFNITKTNFHWNIIGIWKLLLSFKCIGGFIFFTSFQHFGCIYGENKFGLWKGNTKMRVKLWIHPPPPPQPPLTKYMYINPQFHNQTF